jgi:hypothetical protein
MTDPRRTSIQNGDEGGRQMTKQITQRATTIALAAAPVLVVLAAVAGYRIP